MKIVELDINEYKGYELEVTYKTNYIYHVRIKNSKSIKVSIDKKRIFRHKERSFKMRLFEDYVEDAEVFGIFERKTLIAFIEGSLEKWNNTYRIWSLYVIEGHRREGIASALFKHIEHQAKTKGARAIVLEVQSCNSSAIQFYEKQGLHFIGLDTLAYTNNDIEKEEVRLEYGKKLK